MAGEEGDKGNPEVRICYSEPCSSSSLSEKEKRLLEVGNGESNSLQLQLHPNDNWMQPSSLC